MRPSLSLSLLAPALACLAAADSGSLYIYDSQRPSAPASAAATTVSADIARLIIASHLRLDHLHDLGSLDEESIQTINHLSAAHSVFAQSPDTAVALILGQGLDNKALLASTPSHHVQTLQISNMPSVASTEMLITDLASQSGLQPATSSLSQLEVSPAGSTFKITTTQHDFAQTLDTLLRQDYTVLALAVPNDTTSQHTYGKYKHATMHKRSQQSKEAPLITESLPAQEPHLMATSSPKSNNSTPLRGILPQCFPSKSECESMTRNCTGHGSCALKYTNKDARPAASCYSCECTATVVTNKDGGKKTTKWGGPACQKKDIVMPFWLLAGFSIIMVSLISWAIGMLLTMGNEELPSVIGAGVSGIPRSK